MDSGVPGVSGVDVRGPVDEDGRLGPEDVILLLLLMEEMIVRMEMKVSLKAVMMSLVKVRPDVICQYLSNIQKVDGQWGSWGSWSSCTKTCGSGSRSRTRRCDSPAPSDGGQACSGDSSQSGDCGNSPCQSKMRYRMYCTVLFTVLYCTVECR